MRPIPFSTDLVCKVPDAESPQLSAHTLDVRRGPVDPRALRTARERRLRLKHVVRYVAAGRGALDRVQRHIAADTAGQEVDRRGADAGVEHLSKLGAEVVAGHQQVG